MGAAPMLVTAARVITDPRRPPLDGGGVLVADGVVTAVGPARELAAANPSAERRDFPGHTVLPGLVNAHAHLAFDVTTDPRPALEHGDTAAIEATIAANARAALDGGVTTVRDLGDRDGLVAAFGRQVADGAAAGPRTLCAHAPLTPPGGHCWFLGGEVDTRPVGTASCDAALRDAVAERAAQGADVVKIMASGGNLTPSGAPMWQSQFGPHELGVVVAAAREHGLPVAAHAHGTDAMRCSAEAGVDTIEHGSWRAEPGADGAPAYACPDAVAELIAVSGAVLVPTRSRGWARWPPEADLPRQLDQLRWNDRHGIPMIAGNDAGVGQGAFDDLYDAITLFHAAGWTRARALAAATTDAAAALGHGAWLGRIAPGYAADLLVLADDPLADLGALRRIRCVVAAGRPSP